MTTSKKKSNNKAWIFVALFEGTNNDDGNKSIISKINDVIDKGRQEFWVKKVDGSGKHGNLVALRTGGDWPEIIEEMYEAFRNKIKDEGIAISQIDFYVFGFSRGAYQAKVFCNAIDMYGFKLESKELIKKLKQGADDTNQVKNAAKCDRPRIKLLGLFDTVCATKSPPPGLENPIIPSSVKRCRHAIAANEYRECFEPQFINSNLQYAHKYEEQLFPGCHSDIGWAYDRTSKPCFVEKLLSRCFGGNPKQASTKTLCRYAYSWVVRDAATKLGIETKIPLSKKLYAFQYFSLLCCLVFLPHDSYKDFTNFRKETKQRKLGEVHPSELMNAFLRILNCNILDNVNVEVVKVQGQGTEADSEKIVRATDLIKAHLSPNGNEVWIPTCIAKNNRDEKQALLHSLLFTFKDKEKKIYNLLRKKKIITHSLKEEYSALTDYWQWLNERISKKRT